MQRLAVLLSAISLFVPLNVYSQSPAKMAETAAFAAGHQNASPSPKWNAHRGWLAYTVGSFTHTPKSSRNVPMRLS